MPAKVKAGHNTVAVVVVNVRAVLTREAAVCWDAKLVAQAGRARRGDGAASPCSGHHALATPTRILQIILPINILVAAVVVMVVMVVR